MVQTEPSCPRMAAMPEREARPPSDRARAGGSPLARLTMVGRGRPELGTPEPHSSELQTPPCASNASQAPSAAAKLAMGTGTATRDGRSGTEYQPMSLNRSRWPAPTPQASSVPSLSRA